MFYFRQMWAYGGSPNIGGSAMRFFMKVSVYHTGVAMVLGGIIALSGYSLGPTIASAMGVYPVLAKNQERLAHEPMAVPVKKLIECEVNGIGCEDMDADYQDPPGASASNRVPSASYGTLQMLGYPVAVG